MSVVRGPQDAHAVDRRLDCFYCYKPLVYPYLAGMGSSSDIGLHPACFHALIAGVA